MTFRSQTLELMRVDLKVEARIGEVARIVLPFSVVALMVFPLAMGVDLATISRVGIAVFWALGVLFGMQVALRESAEDRLSRRDLHALLGVDPAARFTARVLSGSLLTFAYLVVLLAAAIVLYNPPLPERWPIPTLLALLLVAVGLTELGTLAGDVASGLRHRTAIASLIVAPLALPLVIGGSQAVEALARNAGILPWMLLLTATDLALAVTGIALARPLEEAPR